MTTRFLDAAVVFGPQKGATPTQVEFLTERLRVIARRYEEHFGRDVTTLPGSDAAGGLAGGLAALGAVLDGGFDLVASLTGLDDAVARAAAVVTGEGCFDHSSLRGKVVGGVLDRCLQLERQVLAVVGRQRMRNVPGLDVIALTDVFGAGTSWSDPAMAVTMVTRAWLEGQSERMARGLSKKRSASPPHYGSRLRAPPRRIGRA